MQTKRPGEAAVQYGDARGEAAADMADEIGNLDDAARQLGFQVRGIVLGMSMFSSPLLGDNVSVTVQVFDGGTWEQIQPAAVGSGGKLKVTEYDKEVEVADFLKCFKRLNVSLFTRHLPVNELDVAHGEE